MNYSLVSKESRRLSIKEIKSICKLKDSKWKFGVRSQINWFKKNIKSNDIHNLFFINSKLIGYTLLRKRGFTINNNRKKLKYLLFDSLIIDRNFRVPQKAKIFDLEGKTVIYTQIEERVAEKEFKNRNTEVVFLPKSETWLNDACRHMANEYEVNNVLVESGATFAGTMIDEGLIDQLVIYIAPKLLGNEALPLFRMKKINEINLAKKYEFVDIRKVGKDLRLVMKKKKQ